ncbi:hypothetical protein HK104_001752 [Borealophlyctis nickersoniae]|nr:hypothetical protein HK104_001752 [Borealophlyctis nickersoniae]
MLPSDEREETLREVAAVGNVQAVQFYVGAGVNVNAQNRMNQWTPLHWAAHRSHPQVVRVLLANGASTTLKNVKGQTPADVARGGEVKRLLGVVATEGDADTPSDSDRGYIPNYLAQPDLSKLWGVPGPVSVPNPHPTPASAASGPSPADLVANREVEKTIDSSLAQLSFAPSIDANRSSADTEELLVYILEPGNKKRLVGALFVTRSQSVLDVTKQVQEEIDDLPSNFVVQRYSGLRDLVVPINKKQMSSSVLDHFRKEDAIILCP